MDSEPYNVQYVQAPCNLAMESFLGTNGWQNTSPSPAFLSLYTELINTQKPHVLEKKCSSGHFLSPSDGFDHEAWGWHFRAHPNLRNGPSLGVGKRGVLFVPLMWFPAKDVRYSSNVGTEVEPPSLAGHLSQWSMLFVLMRQRYGTFLSLQNVLFSTAGAFNT